MSMPSNDSTEAGPVLGRSWLYRWVGLPISKAIARFIFLILGPIRSKNAGRIPPSGGVLVLSNHLADVDPIVVQVACQRPIHFMAKSELFQIPILKSFLKFFGAFPVKRGAPDRASIKYAVQLLRAGEVVCVFPEGQLSEDGKLQELKPGIALLARMADCQVICCGLENTNRIMPYGKLIPRPSWHFTWAKWGEPTQFAKDTEPEEIVAWAEKELLSLTGQQPKA